MSSSPRGARLIKALADYSKKYRKWDSEQVLQKTTIEAAYDGRMYGSFVVTEDMCNSVDYLHGGFITSVIDVYTFFSYVTHPLGGLAWSTSMNVDFVRPAVLGDKILVETKPFDITKNRAILDSILRNAATNKIIARGSVKVQLGEQADQDKSAKLLEFDLKDPN